MLPKRLSSPAEPLIVSRPGAAVDIAGPGHLVVAAVAEDLGSPDALDDVVAAAAAARWRGPAGR